MSAFDIDLFMDFNKGEASEVRRRCANCGRFVVVGPPRSGKSFFKDNHLRNNLDTNANIDEYTLGLSIAKTGGVSGGNEGVIGHLKRMIPLIKKLRDRVEVDDEELKRVLGNKGPKPVVEEAKKRTGNAPHRAYLIPWDSDEVEKCVKEPRECIFGADVGMALKLIKEAFVNRRIKWFRAEYIPPGLVKEVVDLIKDKGEEGARDGLRDWVNAYFKVIDILRKDLGVGEDSLDWEEVSAGYLEGFVISYAKYVIGGLATALMGAAAIAFIVVLMHIALKREGKGYVNGIIELKKNLEKLRKPDGVFNELGRLLVYRVAYLMGMSYDEANEALKEIAGIEMDELKKIVEEHEKRITELEEKVNEFDNWINLLKQEVASSIIIAGKADFEQGIVYPNIKVEDSELRIRVEDRYHNLVKTGKFNELVNEVRDRLKSDDVVVIVGPKGIGKSTLAAATIGESLNNYEVGFIARVDVLNEDNYSRFQTFIENYSKKFVKYFGRLLILYDPVSTEIYEEEPGTQPQQYQGESTEAYEEGPRYSRIPKDIETTIGHLVKIKRLKTLGDSGQTILIVLPTDIYNALSEGTKNALDKYKRDALQILTNTEFLAELISEYAKTEDKPDGCAPIDDVLNELASNVAKFDLGHALIARFVGEELARNNCSVGEAKSLISEARGKAEAFMILYINGLFKVHEDPNTAEALVEVFALRRPFINEAEPGGPIVPPGVVKLIGKEKGAKILYSAEGGELRSWLAHRQHDLVEDSIEGLLKCIANEGERCRELGAAMKPWKPSGVGESLKRISEKEIDVDSALKYFADNYGKELKTTLRDSSNCWRRAALIIGCALAGIDLVPKPEGLPEDTKYLGDAFRGCGADDYLLVGNKIPRLTLHLIPTYERVSTEAFIDRYDKAIAEVNMVLNNGRYKGYIYVAERLYGLGLASIIASAAGLGRPVGPGDADVALYIASAAIQYVALPNFIKSVLSALEPLCDKAPHRYLELLSYASTIGNLDRRTVRYVFDELNKVLDNYGDRVKGHAPSLIDAVNVYADLLQKHSIYFNKEEVKGVVGRVSNLLNELGRFKSSLGLMVWASALTSALEREDVRGLMVEALGIDAVNKANEVLGELNKLRGKVRELMRDEEFMSFVESGFIKADEEAIRRTILNIASYLKSSLAFYRFRNDELEEAERLFKELAKEDWGTGKYENYLAKPVNRGWKLRVGAIKGSLVGGKLVDEFRQLYEETFNEERFWPTAAYLTIAPDRLGEYLVSLALTGGDERVQRIKELLEEHLRVLDMNKQVSVLTRLMLNALLGSKDRLDNELEGRLVVAPWELIDAFKDEIPSEYLLALMVTFGMIKPENGIKLCEEFIDDDCIYSVLAVIGISVAVKQLRERLITFHERISKEEMLDLLKKLGFSGNSLNYEFERSVEGLDGKSLVQLLAPSTSMGLLAFMLYALINGDEKLAKAYALRGTVGFSDKLFVRLFLEAYKVCEKGCDLSNEDLRQAITKLFLSHI